MPRYVTLRQQADGSVRPRFSPGPRERALGFKSRDLRHPNGQWFSADEAHQWALQQLRAIEEARAGGARPRDARPRGGPPRRPARRQADVRWVYFIVAGEWVKIGSSNHPTRRMSELQTGAQIDAEFMVAVRGTRRDEAQLHHRLAAYRSRGEWFELSPELRRIMHLSIDCGRVAFREQVSYDGPGVACRTFTDCSS